MGNMPAAEHTVANTLAGTVVNSLDTLQVHMPVQEHILASTQVSGAQTMPSYGALIIIDITKGIMKHSILDIMNQHGTLNTLTNGQKHIPAIMKEGTPDTLQLSMLDQDSGKDYSLHNTLGTLIKTIMHSMQGQDSSKVYTQHTMNVHMH